MSDASLQLLLRPVERFLATALPVRRKLLNQLCNFP